MTTDLYFIFLVTDLLTKIYCLIFEIITDVIRKIRGGKLIPESVEISEGLVIKHYSIVHDENYYQGYNLKYYNPDDPKLDNIYSDIHNIEVQVNNNYRIYHLILSLRPKVTFLREITDRNAAKKYVDQQYFLYTGKHPNIVHGFDNMPSMHIPIGITCELPDKKYESRYPEYLIIVKQDDLNSVSLDV